MQHSAFAWCQRAGQIGDTDWTWNLIKLMVSATRQASFCGFWVVWACQGLKSIPCAAVWLSTALGTWRSFLDNIHHGHKGPLHPGCKICGLALWHHLEKYMKLFSPFCFIFKITPRTTTFPSVPSFSHYDTGSGQINHPPPDPPVSHFQGKSW